MTDSIENVISNQTKSQFEFVRRNTEKSEFLDLVGFWGIAFSVETVICNQNSPCLPQISPNRRAKLATVFAVESKTGEWG